MPDLKFFFDEHLPLAVVEQLRERGVDVVRVEDLGWKGEDDPPLLEYATDEGRSLVTGDRDFLTHHAAWLRGERQHFGVFFVQPQVRQRPRSMIGIIVKALWHYYQAVQKGAADPARDVYNQVIYISGR